MHWHSFWTGWIACSVFMLGVMFLTGCDIPTEYTVNSPNCPWPPPRVSDSTVALVPLGCPYTMPDGTVVNPIDGLGQLGVGGSAGGVK